MAVTSVGSASMLPVTAENRVKAKRLTVDEDTQVWLLASAAEANMLKQGTVPADIQRQARAAMDTFAVGYVEIEIAASPSRKKSRKDA